MSKKIAAAVAGVARGMTAAIPKWSRIATRAQASSALVPRVPVDTPRGKVTLYTPSKSAVYWARHGYAAEPDTLRWIDGLEAGTILWDIGASVGLYSLYAGLRGDLQVLAFEANPFTYESLLRNVHENGLHRCVKPFCAAIAARSELGLLYLSSTEAGTVGNAFGDPAACAISSHAGNIEVAAISLSIDDLVARMNASFPNHLKIDVDSIEDQIIASGRNTLADRRVKSVLVEIVTDTPALKARGEAIIGAMRDHGFIIDPSIGSASGNHLFIRAS